MKKVYWTILKQKESHSETCIVVLAMITQLMQQTFSLFEVSTSIAVIIKYLKFFETQQKCSLLN